MSFWERALLYRQRAHEMDRKVLQARTLEKHGQSPAEGEQLYGSVAGEMISIGSATRIGNLEVRILPEKLNSPCQTERQRHGRDPIRQNLVAASNFRG